MSEQPPINFDAKSVIQALTGTWRYSVPGAPGQMGLIHFSGSGRASQCVFDPTDPEKGSWMRLWYFVESPTVIRFSHANDKQGWRRAYELKPGSVTLRGGTDDVVFTRALPNRIPAWFSDSVG
jgi:hypothetical protein